MKNEEDSTSNQKYIELLGKQVPKWVMLWGILAGPLVIWLLWAMFGVRAALVVIDFIGAKDANEQFAVGRLGQAGDLFGGVNALFAAYAFVGVAIAAYFQQKTFLQIEEQQRQASFEPLFFKLLELNRSLTPGQRQLTEFINELYNSIAGDDFVGKSATWTDEELFHTIVFAYRVFYQRYDAILGPYFRTLYHVFKLIDRSRLPKSQRVEYANIARSMLGRWELYLLVVNGVDKKNSEFTVLMARYGVLKHLEYDGFGTAARVVPKFTDRLYQPTVFMGYDARESYWKENPSKRPIGM
jgi:hypothetical protein